MLTTVSKYYLFTSLVFFFRLVSAYVRNPIQINLSACAKAYFYLHTCAFNRKKKPVYLSKVYPEMNVSENLILLSIFMCLNPL